MPDEHTYMLSEGARKTITAIFADLTEMGVEQTLQGPMAGALYLAMSMERAQRDAMSRVKINPSQILKI